MKVKFRQLGGKGKLKWLFSGMDTLCDCAISGIYNFLRKYSFEALTPSLSTKHNVGLWKQRLKAFAHDFWKDIPYWNDHSQKHVSRFISSTCNEGWGGLGAYIHSHITVMYSKIETS